MYLDPDFNDPMLTEGFNDVEVILAKTVEYLSIPSVVGYEQFFLNCLYKDFKSLNLKVYKHPGLLEVHGETPMSAIVCAHIDRHGLISLGNDEYVYAAQYIREIKYGESNRASQKELESIAKRFAGEHVYAYNPKTGRHLGEGMIDGAQTSMYEGDAIFAVQDLKRIPQGLPLAYARTAKEQDGFLKGQIDNAISLGVIYALFKSGYQGTVLFSTEEEIGKSWIHIANWLNQAKVESRSLLILDTSPYVDKAPIDEGMVIFRNRDMSENFNPELVQTMKTRCRDLGISYQVKDEILLAGGKTVEQLGSTELGKLIKNTGRKWSGATVQIPTLMYHTSNETTSRAAIRNYFTFLADILIKDPLALNNAIVG